MWWVVALIAWAIAAPYISPSDLTRHEGMDPTWIVVLSVGWATIAVAWIVTRGRRQAA